MPSAQCLITICVKKVYKYGDISVNKYVENYVHKHVENLFIISQKWGLTKF